MPSPTGSGALAVDETPAKPSDLGVRTLSAIAMLAVAGAALWFGGIVWTVLVAAVGFGVIREFGQLIQKAGTPTLPQAGWALFAIIYAGLAAWTLIWLRQADIRLALLVIGLVIFTDVGAYFSGRTIGGPKIFPQTSPSKTWAGLLGGVALAALFTGLMLKLWLGDVPLVQHLWWEIVALGGGLAIVAQLGDFFESWLKRRAGVKDSGNLIPGHGGIFDRVDGMLAVAFLLGLSQIYLMLRG